MRAVLLGGRNSSIVLVGTSLVVLLINNLKLNSLVSKLLHLQCTCSDGQTQTILNAFVNLISIRRDPEILDGQMADLSHFTHCAAPDKSRICQIWAIWGDSSNLTRNWCG